MVKFSEEFRERMRKRLEFYRVAELEGLRRELAVSLVKHDNLLSEAWVEGGDVHWFSDEPKAHGGSGRGVSPLAYFLSSLGLCQLVHYAEHAAAEDIPITSLKMTVKGSFSLTRPRSFEEIDYEVNIESPASPELIARLARQAAEDCFVPNTLKKACKVKGYVTHNGFKLLELSHESTASFVEVVFKSHPYTSPVTSHLHKQRETYNHYEETDTPIV